MTFLQAVAVTDGSVRHLPAIFSVSFQLQPSYVKLRNLTSTYLQH